MLKYHKELLLFFYCSRRFRISLLVCLFVAYIQYVMWYTSCYESIVILQHVYLIITVLSSYYQFE